MSSQRTERVHAPAISGRRIRRLLWMIPLLLLGLAAAGLGVMFLRSDIVSFQPRLPQIRQMIERQKVATPTLPPFLVQCLRADGAPDQLTARCLLVQHGLSETDAMRWHARVLFWHGSLRWHLSQAERDLLCCACLNDGAGKTGIHQLSLRLYGRPVEELTEPELAALAVASRSPYLFLQDRSRLDALSKDLLRRIKAG